MHVIGFVENMMLECCYYCCFSVCVKQSDSYDDVIPFVSQDLGGYERSHFVEAALPEMMTVVAQTDTYTHSVP